MAKKDDQNLGLITFGGDQKTLKQLCARAEFGLPDTLKASGNPEQIEAYAREKLSEANRYIEQVRFTADMHDSAVRLIQGAMLKDIHETLGREKMIELAAHFNITERAARNYMALYQHRDKEYIASLDDTKAIRVIQLLGCEGIELQKDTLVFHFGNETRTIGLEQAQECTYREFASLCAAYTKIQRDMEKEKAKNEKVLSRYEKGLVDRDREILQLKDRVKTLEGDGSQIDKEIESIFTDARGLGRRLRFVLDKKLHTDQQVTVFSIVRHLQTIAENFSDEIDIWNLENDLAIPGDVMPDIE